ncbi:UNVERIFIED_CONTAM: hypothetical protein NCL1_55500 [Trichonephila clavipes]
MLVEAFVRLIPRLLPNGSPGQILDRLSGPWVSAAT